MERLRCVVERITYQNSTNGYTVIKCRAKGFDDLVEAVMKELPPTRRKAELLIPFSAGGIAARIRNEGAVEFEEYRPEGLYMKAIVDISFLESISQWILPTE